MKKLIAITGSIACGKSTVSNYLIDLGYEVIDTDKIVHMLYEYNNLGYLAIKTEFPEVIINNEVDRKKLARIVFSDNLKLEKLNSLIHPLVRDEVMKMANNSKNEIIFVDVPLLFESKFNLFVDKTIAVYTDLDTQINRLMNRNNISKDEALNLISKQLSSSKKAQLSDYVIDNSKGLENTYNEVRLVLESIKEDIYA